MSSFQLLASVRPDHPCLWGEVATAPDASWVLESQACLMPSKRTGYGGSDWWKTRRQGALDRHGQPIEALTDLRGSRRIYPLNAQDGPQPPGGPRRRSRTALYGGTLFDHFGHLVLDLTRTYQLLRLFRRSKEPIWFHYPSAVAGSSGIKSGETDPDQELRRIASPLVVEWLDCLGLRRRARLIHKKLPTAMLVSSSVLYRDRSFVSRDFPVAAQAALAPRLRRRLLKLEQIPGRLAYLSRHKLQGGTTRFVGEEEVVAAIADHPRIDVICPEELSIEEKLGLYRRYPLIAGFPQACMNLKCFAPYRRVGDLARQVMFIAGPRSLSSNWVNLDRACGFADRVVDCSAVRASPEDRDDAMEMGDFQRSNHFEPALVVETLRELAG